MLNEAISIRVEASLPGIERLGQKLLQLGQAFHLPRRTIFELRLALEELITNIIKYGYKDEEAHSVEVSLAFGPGEVVVEVEDDGHPFDPLAAPAPDVACALEARVVGGLGIHFLRNLMDETHYERRSGKNRFRMKKSFQSA